MVKSDRSIWNKILEVDVRIIYIAVAALIIIPLSFPLGLPVSPSPPSQKFFDEVMAVPEGGVVYISSDVAGGWSGEMLPAMQDTFKHALMRKLKVVIVSYLPDGPLMFVKYSINVIKPEENFGAVYGEDYVLLGFIPGGETGMAAFAFDIWATTPIDFYGNPIEELPMMENIRSADDIDLVINLNHAATKNVEVARQWYSTFGKNCIVATGSPNVPTVLPYYPWALKGYLIGAIGAGEYENLIGIQGLAFSYTDAISMLAILMLALIIIGNIAGYSVGKQEERGM